MTVRVIIQQEQFNPSDLLREFQNECEDIGAICQFTGLVRSEAEAVSKLTLEHYPGFTHSEILKIAENSARSFGLKSLLIIHRYGPMQPDEAIVQVIASSTHRRASFEAVDHIMDYLKTDAPFWKLEEGPDGTKWIEPRDEDRLSRQKWEQQA